MENIYVYETLSETEWGIPNSSNTFIPRHFNVLNKIGFNKKIEAMKCYKSQIKDPPNSRSLKNIRSQASLRGACIGFEYAECFDLSRSIND